MKTEKTKARDLRATKQKKKRRKEGSGVSKPRELLRGFRVVRMSFDGVQIAVLFRR